MHPLLARFREINGDHRMTDVDDAYVTAEFVVLDDLCRARGRDVDETHELMLAGRLPMPSYVRSDGAMMVPADLFDLADEAGGIDRLEQWFRAQWADREQAGEEWRSYLSGQYVCMRAVTPVALQRKDELTAAITAAPDLPDAGTPGWNARLHGLVDELDGLEREFTAYDRLRFGGPTSRDRCIDAVRARFPRS